MVEGFREKRSKRVEAVERVQAGEGPEAVIRALGCHRGQIYDGLAAYREGGYEALKSRKAPGCRAKLSGRQLQQLFSIITTRHPAQLQSEFALRTRAMVRQVILDRFGVRLSEISVGRLLRKIGLSAQKPLYRAYRQDLQQVAAWREQTYPELRDEARRLNADIYLGDEASVRSDCHAGTTGAPVGQTPGAERTGARLGVNVMAVVSPQGAFRFVVFEGKTKGDGFIEFLKRLLPDAPRRIFSSWMATRYTGRKRSVLLAKQQGPVAAVCSATLLTS